MIKALPYDHGISDVGVTLEALIHGFSAILYPLAPPNPHTQLCCIQVALYLAFRSSFRAPHPLNPF